MIWRNTSDRLRGKPLRVLGIMSGTSLDGVDYALCDVSENGVKLRSLWTVEFPRTLRERLHATARGVANAWELGQLQHVLGRFYAAGATAKPSRDKPQLVGLHGQTVFHNPNPKDPATLQLGEPAYLVETLRVPVVSNFRAADIAAGGQGAPLATIFHQVAFGRRGRHVCVNNLGGISNVTSLDLRKGAAPRVLAFDTGPANVLLDMAARHFSDGRLQSDQNGAWAAQGRANERLLDGWLQHPFFEQPPPKSTGREMFGERFFTRTLAELTRARATKFDALATFTEFTARSIARNYSLHLPAPPDDVVLTGGGAANPVLVESIRARLNAERGTRNAEQDQNLLASAATRVVTSEALDWPVQAIEAAAFALLAWLRVNELPGNIPATTGAKRAVLCGQISEP